MIKVSITNTVNGRTFGATFSTQAEADSWIDRCKSKNSWGLPQRWIIGEEVPAEALQQRQVIEKEAIMGFQEKLDAEGNVVTEIKIVDESSIDPDTGEEVIKQVSKELPVMEEVVVEEAVYYTEYEMPCEYTITVEDVTSVYTAEQSWKMLREERDTVLASTDFTQLADAPIDSTTRVHYRDYRVYLRDLTSHYTDANVGTYKVMTFEEWKAFKKIF